MTMQSGGGLVVWPYFSAQAPISTLALGTSAVLNAAGEICAFIGRVEFAGGPGTSGTLSSAGGTIGWRTGAVTWAGAGTTLKIGLQDVSSAAGPAARTDEDWTGEPYLELVQGTDALSANTFRTDAIEAGSRTVTHGDLIAVVVEMTVLAGADSVIVSGIQVTASNMPTTSTKLGGAWANQGMAANTIITCDDGKLASIRFGLPFSAVTARTFNSTTGTADEYGNVLTPPWKANADSIWGVVALASGSSDYEGKLYSDALNVTAPTAEQTIARDGNQSAGGSAYFNDISIGTETLTPGSAYAVTFRPTTAASITMYEVEVAAASHLKFWPGGDGVYQCTRLNDAGAFTVNTAKRMICGITAYQLSDDAGGAGGIMTHPGMAGGMRG